MAYPNEPIERIEWRQAGDLCANDYSPNVVLNAELKLLSASILRNGWIQPILISADGVIIDGFHRWWLSVNDKAVRERYGGRVPCVVLDLSEPERMLLTVRINRAKGVHVAAKMHDLVTKVHQTYGYSVKEISEQIGATFAEVDLLLREGVFDALNIKQHRYSRAWVPT